MTRVCALANKIGGRHQEHLLALERSLDRAGVPFYFYLESGPWKWSRKPQWEYELTSTYPDDYFVFIDAFDYLFVGDKDELEWAVRTSPLAFSCDAGDAPWPEKELKEAYNFRREAQTPWCWLNGSGPWGKGADIAEACRFGLERVRWKPAWTDQSFWTEVYLRGYGELDQRCLMTQALYDTTSPDHVTPHLAVKNGRLTNLLTLSQPQFIHASGHSWAAIPEELL